MEHVEGADTFEKLDRELHDDTVHAGEIYEKLKGIKRTAKWYSKIAGPHIRKKVMDTYIPIRTKMRHQMATTRWPMTYFFSSAYMMMTGVMVCVDAYWLVTHGTWSGPMNYIKSAAAMILPATGLDLTINDTTGYFQRRYERKQREQE